ncbi:hemolysin type calcium-binding protein [Modicisalibacter xianhensis]|uniref:Hemolysin type calcium-binding protein n=1 Tax=Modicisalibacter xianhensis TaxID=442341 RepID=A0A4R8F882_9GAMM|nr:cellulose binding domain-containing protein [Halomonas xianhensis]TDX21422.1 hemolysin type calcium-binding protein [Halomonas xianhensis]
MVAQVEYRVTSQWNDGFVFEVTLFNSGTRPLADYQVGFHLPGAVTQVWNGRISAQDGERYVITDDDDNNDLAPGETASFKVKALNSSAQLPTGFTVNDQPVIVASPAVDNPVSETSQHFIDGLATVEPGITADVLETLLNEAPSGATVRLAPGEFVLEDSVVVTRSDVSLIGAGSGETTLTFTDAALAKDDLHGILFQGVQTASAGTLQADVAAGDRTLALESGHKLKAGDTVRLWQDNDAAYFEEIGNTTWQGSSNTPLRTSMAKIVALDDNTATLDRGVHFDMDGGQARIQRFDALENITVEGFSVNYHLGTPDPAVFSNTLQELKDYHAVEFDGTFGARMADIEVINGPSVAFEFSRSVDVAADGLHATGAFNKGSGGNGYAYELRESYDGTFTNLADSGMRHSVLFASWRSSVGNQVHVDSTDRDINFHGGQDQNNTIHVDQSLRDPATDNLSPVLWINQGGETFGAPTDPTANQVTFDYVMGSRRDDVIPGSDRGVYLDGARGHDTLLGGTGDDLLAGGAGNDVLEGGEGTDTAFLREGIENYTIRALDDGSVFLEGNNGDDLLVDVERAVFAEGSVLDVESRTVLPGQPPEIPSAEAILADDELIFAPPPADDSLSEEPGAEAPTETSVSAQFESLSRWTTGYVLAVKLTNTGETTIEEPRVSFDLPAEVTQFYGADLVSQQGDTYTVSLGEEDPLAVGETQQFSFKAYAPESHLPEALRLNEVAVDTDMNAILAGDDSTPELSAQTQITSNVTGAWSSGYTAEVIVENISNLALVDPSVSFDLPGEIDTLWNGIAEREGNRYTITDDSPTTLQPGDSWRFSYKVYDTTQALPANTQVEGQVEAPDSEPTTTQTNIINAWSGGYTTEVLVENTSATAIADTTVSFELPAEIDTLWNGVLARDGNHYTVTEDSPNVLQPGEVWRFTYRVYDDKQALPGNIVVEGQAEPAKVAPYESPVDVDNNNNRVTGDAGSTLVGTEGDDTLHGLRGDDYLNGGGGADRLVGGRGADRLTGGGGADTFAYLSIVDSTPLDTDTLLDFSRLEGDRIDVSAIDANTELEGQQSFAWRGSQGFSGNGAELRTSGQTLQGDVNGDGIVDLEIEVLGVNSLAVEDVVFPK